VSTFAISHSGYGIQQKKHWYSHMARRLDPGILGIATNARAIPLQIYDAQTYNPSQLTRYVYFIEAINGHGEDYHTSYLAMAGIKSKLVVLVNARYVLFDRTIPGNRSDAKAIATTWKPVYRDKFVTVFENPTPTAVSWIVHNVHVMDGKLTLNAMKASDFDPLSAAFVEGTAPATSPKAYGAVDSTSVLEYAPETIHVRATAASDGLLVFSVVYEKGWNAYVDGKKVTVLPTDYAFRGVPVPAGNHIVELRYEPASLHWGLWLTVVASLAWALAALWRGWSRRDDLRAWFAGDDVPNSEPAAAALPML